MRMWKGMRYWDGGFENEFSIFPTKKALESEIKRSQTFNWVERTVITDDKGNILYDEQKETPAAKKAEGTSTRKTVKGKKANSEATRIADDSKRRVCRPQDI